MRTRGDVTGPDRFTALPNHQAIDATILALAEHGFIVDVVEHVDAVPQVMLVRIPADSSVTFNETSIAEGSTTVDPTNRYATT